MSDDLIARLTAAVDALEARTAEARRLAAAATPGEWFYDSYSRVFAADLVQPYDDWLETTGEHGLERYKACEVCGTWTFKANGYTFSRAGCKLSGEDNNLDPLVASVPPRMGDTAMGRHQADAQHIAFHDPAAVLADCDRDDRLVEWGREVLANVAWLATAEGATCGIAAREETHVEVRSLARALGVGAFA